MWTRKHIFRKIVWDFETKRGIRRATHVDKSWRVKTKLCNFPPNSLQNSKAFHIFRPESGSHERLSLKGVQRRRKCVLWFDLNRHRRVWYNCYMFVMVSLTILSPLTIALVVPHIPSILLLWWILRTSLCSNVLGITRCSIHSKCSYISIFLTME